MWKLENNTKALADNMPAVMYNIQLPMHHTDILGWSADHQHTYCCYQKYHITNTTARPHGIMLPWSSSGTFHVTKLRAVLPSSFTIFLT